MQIDEHFEKNNLLGNFQFGFRKNKSTITELLTLFDSIMEAKEAKKEILVLLYDLSSAFDTVSHEVLLTKMEIYGFNKHALKWLKSYLEGRKQCVTISGKISSALEMETGTPQGSRMSPLLFIILMADMDLWIDNSKLSNFADDTQSLIISDNVEEALEITTKEANKVINFFGSNNLVNNPEKAAVLYNSKGISGNILIKNIGSEQIISTDYEKLLGLHLNSDFGWNTHVDKISIELKKRIGLLRRIKNRVPQNKLVIIANAIFNSIIRYGIAVYLKPVFDEEDVKEKKLSKNAKNLQTLQNLMLRVIFGFSKTQHINMQKLREKIELMSVNQMCVYHTILEAHNINVNSSSEQIKLKWSHQHEVKYFFRSEARNDQKVPEKPTSKCTGFSYYGAKLYNKIPCDIRKTPNSVQFKALVKEWTWKNIPSF